MAEPSGTIYSGNITDFGDARGRLRPDTPLSTGGGGGTFDPMEARVIALEDGMKDIKATLKELRDGQQAAALAAVQNAGALNTRFAEMDTKFAEVNGKLGTITTVSEGLRRDLDKLPSKFDVATIMITVIGGLGAAALLIKNVWPVLAKAFGP